MTIGSFSKSVKEVLAFEASIKPSYHKVWQVHFQVIIATQSKRLSILFEFLLLTWIASSKTLQRAFCKISS